MQKLACIPPTTSRDGKHPENRGDFVPGLTVDAGQLGRVVTSLALGRPVALAVRLADDEFQNAPAAPAEAKRTVEGG